MSVTSEITRIINNISSAYTACNAKGAIMPQTQNSANLANCISSITTNSGNSKYGLNMDSILGNIDANGVLQAPAVEGNLVFTNVQDIAADALYNSFSQIPTIKSVSFPNLTNISGATALRYAFMGCTGLTNINLSDLVSITGNEAMLYAFSGCSNLSSVNLSNLTTINAQGAFRQVFQNCSSLTGIDLSALTTVKGTNAFSGTFNGCTNLASIDFSNLVQIGDYTTGDQSQFTGAFIQCTSLTSLSFPKLEKIYCTGNSASQGTFYGNQHTQKLYFPKLDTIAPCNGSSSREACNNIFYNCNALTEIHFGSANQQAIEATTGYSTLWGRGAGNATVYFDL